MTYDREKLQAIFDQLGDIDLDPDDEDNATFVHAAVIIDMGPDTPVELGVICHESFDEIIEVIGRLRDTIDPERPETNLTVHLISAYMENDVLGDMDRRNDTIRR